MSSAVNGFVHAICKCLKKVPRIKSGTFWFLWMDSHDSTTIPCVALSEGPVFKSWLDPEIFSLSINFISLSPAYNISLYQACGN